MPALDQEPGARRWSRSLGLYVTAIAILLALAPESGASRPDLSLQSAPPTLQLERVLITPSIPGQGQMTVQASCNRLGNSSFSFTATGTATGPYPGVFQETGTVEMGPQPESQGVILVPATSFHATFSIQSAIGHVDGTLDLALPHTGLAACGTFGQSHAFGFFLSQVLGSGLGVQYVARITTQTGVFLDHGSADTTITALDSEQTLNHVFISDLTSPIPVSESPGHSPPVQPGKGCGDKNHDHEKRDLCKK